MQSDRSSLGERLLAVEPLSIDSRQILEKELHSMFIRELSATRRIMFAIVAVVALVSAGICAALALTEPTLPVVARIGLATGTLFGLAWTVVGTRVALRGTIDLKIDNRRIAAMVWTFTTLMMVFFLIVGMSSKDRLLGLMMIGNGLAFLIGAAVYWLTHRIEESELNTRERLLQLELRLAEFCERQ